MKDYDRILGIIEFLGDNVSDDQIDELMDQIKRDLSETEIKRLVNEAVGPIYENLTAMKMTHTSVCNDI